MLAFGTTKRKRHATAGSFLGLAARSDRFEAWTSTEIGGGGGGNRTRSHVHEKRAMVRDFRCQGSILSRFRCPFESPGVPYSPLESTPVLEIFWRRAVASAGPPAKMRVVEGQ